MQLKETAMWKGLPSPTSLNPLRVNSHLRLRPAVLKGWKISSKNVAAVLSFISMKSSSAGI